MKYSAIAAIVQTLDMAVTDVKQVYDQGKSFSFTPPPSILMSSYRFPRKELVQIFLALAKGP